MYSKQYVSFPIIDCIGIWRRNVAELPGRGVHARQSVCVRYRLVRRAPPPNVSLFERLARLFREPAVTDETAAGGEPPDAPLGDRDDRDRRGVTDGSRDDGGDGLTAGSDDGEDVSTGGVDDGTSPAARTDAVAVVVQAPPEGVRRYELTLRADVPVAGVEPGLLTSLFETFDEGPGAVRARAVDVDGRGSSVEAAAPLFVARFAEPVDPGTVSLDGSIDGHDEEPVPWSRVRLTPVD